MKAPKQIKLISFATVVFFGLGSYFYYTQDTNVDSVDKSDLETLHLQLVNSDAEQSRDNMKVELLVKTDEHVLSSENQQSNSKSIKRQQGKKHYDEQWCNAKKELSESDYQFAQTELRDWEQLIGKARVKGSRASEDDEISFPNHSYIESYEALPIDQLYALAKQGDKWAMVAYLQDNRVGFRERHLQDSVAEELLIEGGSYYALQHLVLRSLNKAKTSIRQSNQDEAVPHVVDALAYAYWGLEHYSDGGLGSFLAVVTADPFKTSLPLGDILPNSLEQIKYKLAELTMSINEQRVAKGVDIPEAPAAVRKMFAKDIAIQERQSRAEFKLLRSLNIIENDPIESTACVKQYVDFLDKVLGD